MSTINSIQINNFSSNDYHFITHWRVCGTLKEVGDILGQPTDLVHWWPAVYLAVKELEPGDENGIGRVVDLYTKGWLPYTLRWQFRVTESNPPHGFCLEAWGDFVGRGIWLFKQVGDDVLISYDWKIRADKPLLRNLSFIMKPIFAANHRWAMAQGEESLRRELVRRRSRSPEEKYRLANRPGPTFYSVKPWLIGLVGLISLTAGLTYWKSHH